MFTVVVEYENVPMCLVFFLYKNTVHKFSIQFKHWKLSNNYSELCCHFRDIACDETLQAEATMEILHPDLGVALHPDSSPSLRYILEANHKITLQTYTLLINAHTADDVIVTRCQRPVNDDHFNQQ